MAKTARRRRTSKKQCGGYTTSDQYVNAVYGVPQVAASANNNTIAMQAYKGGALLPLSPVSLVGASQGLSEQGTAALVASSNGAASVANSLFAGGAPLLLEQDNDNNIRLGGKNRKMRKGGKIGLEELVVPVGLLVANQLVGKPRQSKRNRRSSRRRR